MNKDLRLRIWFFTIAVILIGLMALYSACVNNVRVSRDIFYDQCWAALWGLIVMYALSKIDYRKFYDIAYLFFGLSILLLWMVLVVGRHALGAQRWLEWGSISFQPSELTKLSLILCLARYFSTRRPALSFDFLSQAQRLWRDLLLPFMMAAVPMYLIFKQPDLGTAILIFGIFFILLFISGLELKVISRFFILCLGIIPFAWHVLKEYQRNRLLVFLNPNIDPLGAGYTIIQSKIAIGSGQWLGKGWLAGTQNQLNFLPERHTDFIFSVIGEEWGFVGGALLIFCYLMIIRAGLRIAEQMKDPFGVLVTGGIVALLTMQVVINMGMVMGLLPVVGLTLPLVSYGRTSFLVFMVILGLLLNLSKKRSVF